MTNNNVFIDDTKLDSIVESFELSHCAGEAPEVVDYLPSSDDPEYDEILVELVRG